MCGRSRHRLRLRQAHDDGGQNLADLVVKFQRRGPGNRDARRGPPAGWLLRGASVPGGRARAAGGPPGRRRDRAHLRLADALRGAPARAPPRRSKGRHAPPRSRDDQGSARPSTSPQSSRRSCAPCSPAWTPWGRSSAASSRSSSRTSMAPPTVATSVAASARRGRQRARPPACPGASRAHPARLPEDRRPQSRARRRAALRRHEDHRPQDGGGVPALPDRQRRRSPGGDAEADGHLCACRSCLDVVSA
jgi:hypothetical protein